MNSSRMLSGKPYPKTMIRMQMNIAMRIGMSQGRFKIPKVDRSTYETLEFSSFSLSFMRKNRRRE